MTVFDEHHTECSSDKLERKQRSPHTFHIPVMGTGFTIDTPVRAAKYGISSVISLGDDVLIEQMRRVLSAAHGHEYREIKFAESDYRARRITAYLDLVDSIVKNQIENLRKEPFEQGYDIVRYFELLPDCPLKTAYLRMLECEVPSVRTTMQETLRCQIVPGSIDVNIMTKIDADRYVNGVKQAPEDSLAMSSLRGFALSTLRSSVVFSAGMNRRLYAYVAQFDDFLPGPDGVLKKKVILKVSDYRSALLQGKLMASRGVWVSEYRIESGLNCGGHAFASKGQLLGPILEQFRHEKSRMVSSLYGTYNKALKQKGLSGPTTPLEVRITVQGGLCSGEEDEFLRNQYKVDGTGWGSPFLLVPEVVNIDDVHLQKLEKAGDSDIHLSNNSPLGVPFWNLRNSASEKSRLEHINEGKPGSKCPKAFLAMNTEFTERPICTASRSFQKRRLKALDLSGLTSTLLRTLQERVVDKACLCRDLAGSAALNNGLDFDAKTAVCCGPSIAWFSHRMTLEEIIDRIYGRERSANDAARPHMFIKELSLYVDYLKEETASASKGLVERTTKYFDEFTNNLSSGIAYYRRLAEHFSFQQREKFLRDLEEISRQIDLVYATATPQEAVAMP